MPKRSSTPSLSKLSRPRLFGAVPRERLFGALDGVDRLRSDGGGTLDEAERACALYQGALLPGDTDAPWAVSIRERLRARHVEQVGRIGRHFEGASQWDRAASWYQRGIDGDPLMESFYQCVIRCYAQTGRRAEALSTYRRLRQTLSVVLGIEPSATTQALYGSLYSA